MAKGNLFLSQARGRLGSVVFYRQNGEQISRSYTSVVKNPKVFGQKVQRAIFNTVSKAASMLRPIVDHSWYGVDYGTMSMREFRSVNLGLIRRNYLADRYDLNFSPKGGGFVPNPYQISRGSLPQFTANDTDGTNVNFQMGVQNSAAAGDNTELTKGAFFNTYPYLQGGDQITLVVVEKTTAGRLEDGTAPSFAMRYWRAVLAPQEVLDEIPSSTYALDDSDLNPDLLDTAKSSPGMPLCAVTEGGGLYMGIRPDYLSNIYCAALILSRWDAVKNTWNRSTQTLHYISDDVQNLNEVIESYGDTAAITTQGTEYLNAALEVEDTPMVIDLPNLSVRYLSGATIITDAIAAVGEAKEQTASITTGSLYKVLIQANSSDRYQLQWVRRNIDKDGRQLRYNVWDVQENGWVTAQDTNNIWTAANVGESHVYIAHWKDTTTGKGITANVTIGFPAAG